MAVNEICPNDKCKIMFGNEIFLNDFSYLLQERG